MSPPNANPNSQPTPLSRARSLPVIDRTRIRATQAREEEIAAAFSEAVTEPAAANASSLRGVLKNISLSRRYDLTTLEPDALTLDEEAKMEPACEHCNDRCCADPVGEMSLRLLDLARLRDAGLEGAIEVRPPLHSDRHRDLKETERRDSYRHFPTLAKTANGSCILFGDDGRCQAWEVRPLACRRFPHRLSDDRTTVTWNSRCSSRGRRLTDDEQTSLRQRIAADYNTKLRDLATLVHGDKALRAAGLKVFLPLSKVRG